MPAQFSFSGGTGGPAVPAFTDSFSLGIKVVDSNATPTDAASFAMALSLADSNATPTEAVILKFPAGSFSDTNAAPTDSRSISIRSWATGCTDNDASKTNPANANGQPGGAPYTKVSTNLSLGDITNPVELTTGSMNYTYGGTGTAKNLYLYFKIADARVSALDTVVITWSDGTNSGTAWTWGLVAEDRTGTPLIVALADAVALATMVVKVTYTASVVAAPQSVLGIQIDAIGLQATTTL